MRVLIVHHRYFVSGGPERYLFNLAELLEEHGHEVVPFSVQHPRNVATPFERYFLSGFGGDEVYFDEIPKTPRTLFKLAARNWYSVEAARKLDALLRAHPVDVAYLLGYLRWMSPSVIHALTGRRVPIVARLSDFHLLCPQTHFLREGRPCELCKTGALSHAVRYRCVRGSLALTGFDVSVRLFHRWIGTFEKVTRFVAPSQFLLKKMVEAGYGVGRLAHVPTFVHSHRITPDYGQGSYVLYFGRMAPEKGLDVLLSAWRLLSERGENRAGVELRIVGVSNRGERERLERRVAQEGISSVWFGDHLPEAELGEAIARSRCTVVPSLWYENMPNAVLESFARGKPVIASNIGSLPELVRDGETGLLCEPGNPDDLRRQLCRAIADPDLVAALGRAARRVVERECSPEQHYARLLRVFEDGRAQAPTIH